MPEDDSNPELGTGATIYINPEDSERKILTESIDNKTGKLIRKNQKTPLEIIIGHELIHTYRCMMGQRSSLNHIKYARGYAPREEIDTIGITSRQPNNAYSKSIYRFTENALREEHGYAKRIKY